MEILKFKSQLFVAFEQVTAPRRHVQSVLVKLKKSVHGTLHSFQAALRLAENGLQAHGTLRGLLDRVIERRRRLRQEMRARENELRELLANSLDAIVVTNLNRRFVAANPKALELFGVSG